MEISSAIILWKKRCSGERLFELLLCSPLEHFCLYLLYLAAFFHYRYFCLAIIFGGMALAAAPALSVVNEYHTSGPVTKTLIHGVCIRICAILKKMKIGG